MADKHPAAAKPQAVAEPEPPARAGVDAQATHDPGWSNSPEDHGIGTRAAPGVAPGGVDMSQPGWSNNGPKSTSATAGTPGGFLPANSDTPNALASMTGVTASPATAWTTGQYVVIGDGSEISWNGTAWVNGRA